MIDSEPEIEKQIHEKAIPVSVQDGGIAHSNQFQRGIKTRHAHMIAIGGTIGTGLFVGTGEALAIAGPAPLLGVYVFVCILIYGIITATSEMATYLPIPGCSMAYYGHRFVSRSLGFAMGWLYVYSFGILIAYEITAAGLVIDYWPSRVHIAVWISIMLAVVIVLNLCPVRAYAETEFWFASIKIIMIIGLLMLSVVLFFGGGPNHQRLGFHYWKSPGAANPYLVPGAAGRLCSVIYVACFSVFSFNFAPELLVVTAGEMRNPRRNLPTATKQYFYRLMIFYVLGVLAIGIICSSKAPGLTSGESSTAASPWVIAIKEAGIYALDSVVNGGIIISAWSSANSYLYMSSRSLYSLAMSGNAPAIFTRCTRWGTPYMAVLGPSVLGVLAYLNCGNQTSEVFNWLISLTNTSGFISWVCCGIVYLRFRMACQAQSVLEMPYRSRVQPFLIYLAMCTFAVLLLLNGFSVFFPGHWSISTFLTSYIGFPAFLAIYFGHRLYAYKDPWLRDPTSVDLHSGLAEVEADSWDEQMPHGDLWGRLKTYWNN